MMTDGHPRRALAVAALALGIAGISWSAVFVRWADVPPVASAFYRVLIAAVVLVPWWLSRRMALPAPGADAPRVRARNSAAVMALAGGVFFAFDLALFNAGLLKTRAATAVLLANVAPVFVGLASWLVSRRRPRARFWIGLLVAIGGCGIIARRDVAAAAGSMGTLAGDLLALGAAVFWAAYLVTTERARLALDTLSFNALAMVGSALTLLLTCLAMGEPLWGYTARAWLALAGLGLVSQLGAYLGLTYALGHLPATVVSSGLLIQVPLTAILAALLLGEPITAVHIGGGILVIAGVVIVNRGRR